MGAVPVWLYWPTADWGGQFEARRLALRLSCSTPSPLQNFQHLGPVVLIGSGTDHREAQLRELRPGIGLHVVCNVHPRSSVRLYQGVRIGRRPE